jgi:hypothetical protein
MAVTKAADRSVEDMGLQASTAPYGTDRTDEDRRRTEATEVERELKETAERYRLTYPAVPKYPVNPVMHRSKRHASRG